MAGGGLCDRFCDVDEGGCVAIATTFGWPVIIVGRYDGPERGGWARRGLALAERRSGQRRGAGCGAAVERFIPSMVRCGDDDLFSISTAVGQLILTLEGTRVPLARSRQTAR